MSKFQGKQNCNSKLKSRLKDFYKELNEVCIGCARKASDVKVLYATKYLNPKQFGAFLNIVREIDIVPVLIGENRVQEAREKMEYLKQVDPELRKSFSYVMIGTLQRNKINKAIVLFDEIHSLDSLELAKALDQRLERERKIISVFLEVNVSGEETKHGFRVEEMDAVIKELKSLKSLKLEGLMTMAPHRGDLEEIRGIYRKLKELASGYKLQTSMGMSSDWKVAVEEGADMIRVGSAIFK